MNIKNFLCFAAAMLFTCCVCRAAETSTNTIPSAVYAVQETAEFKTLVKAAIEARDAGKKEEMVAKLTDLETACAIG